MITYRCFENWGACMVEIKESNDKSFVCYYISGFAGNDTNLLLLNRKCYTTLPSHVK